MQRHYQLNPTTGNEDASMLPWTNGVPQTGQEGSYPPAALCTDPQDEILNVITAANITPLESDLSQLLEAIRALIAAAIPNIPSYTGAEGVKIVSGVASADIPDLTEEDSLDATDQVMFYQAVSEGGQAAGHHRKTSFANFAAKVLALINNTPQSGYAPPSLPLAQSVFSAVNNTPVSVGNATPTAIVFPAGSCVFGAINSDGARFVFSRTGRYIVAGIADVAVGSGPGNVNSQVTIDQNGTAVIPAFDNSYEAGSGTISPTVTTSIPIIVQNVGDYVRILGTGYSYGTFFGASIMSGMLIIVSL